ncbi:MAG: endonuclease domain-containing protein [Deltaproteobacteria bacterium]|nr:endonuclease domain-containing protein [Deltaproteobacteria bacterium]
MKFMTKDNPIHNRSILKQRRKDLRNGATSAEKKLWACLQRSALEGHKFRRQHSVGAYILDFYCPAERLAIELDGDSHFTDEAIEYDNERTGYLNGLNIRVLRFMNSDIYDNLDSVCERILEEIRRPAILPVGGDFTTPNPLCSDGCS